MRFTDNEMSVILLCSQLGLEEKEGVSPLSLGQWNAFLDNLIRCGLEPKVILENCQDVKNMGYDDQELERIKRLADRGASVAFALDDYEKRGIHTITLLNDKYPVMLKSKLKTKKPPVLFYAGDIELAGKVGIGVVGSRNLSVAGADFIGKLVEKAVGERMVIYSGGARGADSVAENTAMATGGAAVEFLADSLATKIKKKDISQRIIGRNMLLISDYLPTAGFSAARAMNRNKYIYGSAYGTFVAESDYNTGGTWAGATEAMKQGYGKVLVWKDSGCEGNKRLIEAGGIPYSIGDNRRLYDIITTEAATHSESTKATDKASGEVEGQQLDFMSIINNDK